MFKLNGELASTFYLRKSRPEINSDLDQGHTGWFQCSRNWTQSPQLSFNCQSSFQPILPFPGAEKAVHYLPAHDFHLVVSAVIAAYGKIGVNGQKGNGVRINSFLKFI